MDRFRDKTDVTVLQRSLLDKKGVEITARVSYILVRDNIPLDTLKKALNMDDSLPYFAQPGRGALDILYEAAQFLGVTTDWLISGVGRNTRVNEGLENYTRSAVLKSNQAEVINVHNYAR